MELEHRRYDSDKIKSVELRVKRNGFHRTLVLIFQYTDCIVSD